MTSAPPNLAPLVPVSSSSPKPSPQYQYLEPSALSAKIEALGYAVDIREPLKGGKVSQVHAALDANGNPVVVKYTYDMRSDDPTELYLHHSSHFVDAYILKVLAQESSLRVPIILKTFGEFPITVMEDLRTDGFRLVHDTVLEGQVPSISAGSRLGRELANMLRVLAHVEPITTMLSPQELFFDRGLELKEAYPNTRLFYEMRDQFEHENYRQLIPVDTHIKNVFLDRQENSAWIDFGFSTYGDPQFVLPNFLSHFGVYAIAGFIDRSETAALLDAIRAGFEHANPVDQKLACRYMALEMLHRWAGKRVVGIDDFESQQLPILRFARAVIDRNVDQLDDVFEMLASSY